MPSDKYTDLEDYQTSRKKKKKQKPSKHVDESLEDDASASDGLREETDKRGKSPKSRKSNVNCDRIGDSQDVSVTEHNPHMEGTLRRKKKKKHMRDGDRHQVEDSLSGDLLASDDLSTVSIADDNLHNTEPTNECEDRAGKPKKKKKKYLHTHMKDTSTNLLESDDYRETMVRKSLKKKKSDRSRDLVEGHEETSQLEQAATSALGANPKTKKKRSKSHCNASPELDQTPEPSEELGEYGNTDHNDGNPAAAVLSKKRQRCLGQTSDLDESSNYHSPSVCGRDAKKRKTRTNSDADVQASPKRKKCTFHESQDTESFSPVSERINENMSFDKYTDLEDHQTPSKKKKKQKPSQQVDESLDDDVLASDSLREETNKSGKSLKKRKSGRSCDNVGDSEDVSIIECNTHVEGTLTQKKHMRDGYRHQMEDSLSGDLVASDDHSTVSLEYDILQTTECEDQAGKSTKKKKKSLLTSMEETSTSLLEETEFETDNGTESHFDSSPETDRPTAEPYTSSDNLDENQNAGGNGAGLSAADVGMGIVSPPKQSRKSTASLYIRDRDLALIEEVFPNVRSLSFSSLQYLIRNELERIKEAKLRGIKFVTGRFNQAEDEQIKKNVEEFLALTGLESGEMLFHSYRYPELKPTIEKLKRKFHFRQRIAKGVYHTMQEISHRGPKLYDSSGSKGRFTDEEVKTLKESWNLHGNNWTTVGALIGRNNTSAQLKASQLRRKVNQGLWSTEETNLLISAVKEFVLNSCQKTAESRDQEPIAVAKHKIYKGIPWVKIEEKVKTRNWTHCKRKWFDLALIRMNDGINPFVGPLGIDTYINMINWLHESHVKESGKVKWEELTDYIGNIPPWIAQTRFHSLKKLYVPDFKKLSFSDTMDYLYHVTLPQLEAKLEQLSYSEQCPLQVPEKRDQFLVSEIFQEYTESDRMQKEFHKRLKSKRRSQYVRPNGLFKKF